MVFLDGSDSFNGWCSLQKKIKMEPAPRKILKLVPALKKIQMESLFRWLQAMARGSNQSINRQWDMIDGVPWEA